MAREVGVAQHTREARPTTPPAAAVDGRRHASPLGARPERSALTRRLSRVPAVAWFLFGMAAIVAVAVAASIVTSNRPGYIQPAVDGYRQIAPHEVALTFTVDKAPLAKGLCTVIAENSQAAIIGSSRVVIGPNVHSLRDMTVTADIHTSAARAFTALVENCRIIRNQ